jgi:tRNA A-37 threonylcarbamoyl transferase component Bud32
MRINDRECPPGTSELVPGALSLSAENSVWIELSSPYRAVLLMNSILFCLAFLTLVKPFLGPNQEKTIDFYTFLGLPFCLIICIISICEFFRRSKIKLSHEGLQFDDSSFRRSLMKRPNREWSDIHSIQFLGNPAKLRWRNKIKWYDVFRGRGSTQVVIDFKSGGTAEIDLHHVCEKQAELLFRSLELWADTSTFSPDIVRLKKTVLIGAARISFTEVWQDDLNCSYIATNYIPLPSNHVLQDGRYRILVQMTSGGMSTVYLALNDRNEKVVLKEAAPPNTTNAELLDKARELFERETRILSKLSHPAIAKVLDSFRENNRDYLVLEYIQGRTVRQVVGAAGGATESATLKWTKDLCDILKYLHSQLPPLIHRDLTPDNIMVREDGSLVLIDFGAASEYLGNCTGTFVGKQCYIAPEQLRGRACVQSDIYSLGATMFFMLTGTDPVPLSQSRPGEKASFLSPGCDELVASARRLISRPPVEGKWNSFSATISSPSSVCLSAL